MSVKYKLVLKKDLTKGATADAKRYYASAPVSGMMDFDSICELIADRSTASDGDVALVVLEFGGRQGAFPHPRLADVTVEVTDVGGGHADGERTVVVESEIDGLAA